ncbi:MAG TPA: peptide-binding protein [Cyanobacteria bacterium UBA11149]|nr:peptide-binding protein [Cyanobacteria bacterium UBA11367]HBE57313.1 peptide-binding protein [Cyanobacteria bacterium UBA11366]HBK66103.1 peptide-binding protein [Cyanobacteria bacterium UBA11166]HBR77230.1 peptide-binding protein [Cyanobacteria bacterium UBA11159]HBS67672.1 peptide-binding protein [Cyanobacteria bacterium UBA11153]HBW92165.1 peptide-binding protein [Cyanobacteria bacterium UBA11149]HCA96135.1 peptide-binding protein [Cyanobacteria bacterium UBA9226]
MIVCPNCNHKNPDGASQCEACFTPLPTTTSCPNCGASVQTDATFCGQCGFNLKPSASVEGPAIPTQVSAIPDLINPDPLVELEPIPINPEVPMPDSDENLPPTTISESAQLAQESPTPLPPPPPPPTPIPTPPVRETNPPISTPRSNADSGTVLQNQSAILLHLQTNTQIELPVNLSVIHIGKPNDRIPPDVDVSGFPHSDIVSRIHADIRVEGDAYYIEDVGSANGTYINHNPLASGNRHKLRHGDRISLGRGDLVTFLFQNP